jgi:predicted nucleic acid-binding protein
MVLVDSSVWIAVFHRDRPLDLAALVDFDDVVTCLSVVQEVLQGFRDEQAFRKARVAMLNLPIVDAPLEQPVVDVAIDLYRQARRAGVTVRSSVDCLIAASAIRHGLTVLHRDRDYTALSKISALQARSV